MARPTRSVAHEVPSGATPKALLPVALGTGFFLAWQFLAGVWRLANRSGGMDNKFSALAREKFLEFLIWENLQVALAYLLLWVAGILLVLPLASAWTARSRANRRPRLWIALRSFLIIALIHGWFMLR